MLENETQIPLVDVVALSKQNCQHPIQAKLKYGTTENFVGRIIDGYDPSVTHIALMTPKAAKSLCDVQKHLNKKYQLGLYVYDAYRPKRAVQDWLKWSQQPPTNEYELIKKAEHYPHINKSELFSLGYVNEDSSHCYGNTVDLVLIDLKTQHTLDMGAQFDFMDELSHYTATVEQIGAEAIKNRKILRDAMEQFSFQAYAKEFWHFCYGGRAGHEVNKPLDVEITPDLIGIGVIDAFKS